MHNVSKLIHALRLMTLSIALIFSTIVGAEGVREINIASEAWEDATNKDGTGLYWDIIRMVYEPVGVKVNLSTTSYSRSVALVKQQKNDAWVGSYMNEEEGVLYPKHHFDADIVSALFLDKDGSKTWLGEKSLEGKSVGWIKGYELHEYLEVSFEKREQSDRKNIMSLLKAGRLDYFIDAAAELESYFGEEIAKNKALRMETIKHLNLYLAFANNARGKELSQIFDKRFGELLASGELKKLFEKWESTYIF